MKSGGGYDGGEDMLRGRGGEVRSWEGVERDGEGEGFTTVGGGGWSVGDAGGGRGVGEEGQDGVEGGKGTGGRV